MTVLTDRQWQVAQSWIGTAEPLATFQKRYDALEDDLDLAILESLRAQLMELNGQPGSLSLPSGLSISVGENLRAFQAALKDFKKEGGTDGVSDGQNGTRFYQRLRTDLR